MFKKLFSLAYGLISYSLFVAVFTYTIFFIGNILVSPSLDSIAQTDLATALMTDLGLLTLFALQHSIMARPAFKKVWTKIIPEHLERSTYVLASTICLGAIVYFWQPLGGLIWQVENETLIAAIYAVFALGWVILFWASFEINHFDLFGLRQTWLYFKGVPYSHIPFKKPFLYRHVRHPLYVGMMMGLWAAPTMTITHLAFAAICTAYIVVGTLFEEHDLKNALPEYEDYSREVPMFIPSVTGSK